MSRIRFLMIGGFLGAGKTTAMARLARHYLAQGKNVGLVTNDQAYDLVDTHALRAQGFHVGEVPGACFCCKFDELVETVAQLSSGQQPDVILTEPVGSCTDLVATVIEPLRYLHGDQFDIGPLLVLCKPEHGRKILSGGEQLGFSPKAAYLFLKQLEEADLIVVNKIDTIEPDELQKLMELVQNRFPGKTVLAASGKTGAGFDRVLQFLESTTGSPTQSLDIDYEIYAQGEAELGWLNCSVHWKASSSEAGDAFEIDRVVLELVERIAKGLSEESMEAAHLKVLGMEAGMVGSGATSIANLVSSDSPVELSLAAEVYVSEANLIINARVAGDPERLAHLVRRELADLARAMRHQYTIEGFQHFRPAPPQPTHRGEKWVEESKGRRVQGEERE